MTIKVPKNQILWVTRKDENQTPKYIITSDNQRTKYILYKVLNDGSLEKIKTAKEPIFKEV